MFAGGAVSPTFDNYRKNITRPKILTMNGLNLGDFPDHAKALQCADRLIAKSEVEFEFEHEADEDAEMPLLSRFRYIHSKGKSSSWIQTENKQLSGVTVVKNAKQLKDSAAMMEALGAPGDVDDDKGGVGQETSVTVTSNEWDLAHTSSIELRLDPYTLYVCILRYLI